VSWQVYIIEASDNRLYTGITTDVERRFEQHLCGKGGAKFFRGRSPKALRYIEDSADRSTASKREAEIKKLSRAEKLAMIADYQERSSSDE
jgi:putative endonuclease